MILRQCVKCGLIANNELELENFVPRKEQKYGRRNICFKCHQEDSNKHSKNRFRKNKKKAIKYKGSKCVMCNIKAGEVHDAVFDFHHLDPSQKELNIGKIMHHRWDKIREELDKCILLCSNCHRIIHADDY